ncbi:MAG: glycoside hydrolase family 2 protein, partial [Bacteroidaceae bacterium]
MAQTERKLINDDWLFYRLANVNQKDWVAGQQGTGWESQFNVEHTISEGTQAFPLLSDSLLSAERHLLAEAKWQSVCLPHTAFVEPYVIQKPWQGVCYYRRTLPLTPKQKDGRVLLEFEGAMQLADIWVNDKHVATHAGGFTTFVVDITEVSQVGDNDVVVRLDNNDNGLIPPGKSLGTLDFCYHSGLYRDVFLVCKPNIQITHPLLTDRVAGGGVRVSYPEVNQGHAVVQVYTEVADYTGKQNELVVRQSLYTWHKGKGRGNKVASVQQTLHTEVEGMSKAVALTQRMDVANPRLWSPDSPNLYILCSELLQDGRVVDVLDTRIGIRQLEITREGCFINGKRYYLDGTNRHQEYPYVGNALSDCAQYRDVWQMRWSGFNTVRLGHYPQDPSVLDACDELGLLAIEPIPGWQYYTRDSVFINLTYRNIQEMIRRDRNHPSIIMWETTLNESWPDDSWKDGAIRTAHAELPDGPCYTSGDTYGYNGFDVCYNDWDQQTFSRPNHSGKPSFIREYYDYEFGGHYSTTRVTRGDGEKALLQNQWNAQWSQNSNRLRSEATIGGAVWSMYDYNRGCCDNICYSGVADLFRRPK